MPDGQCKLDCSSPLTYDEPDRSRPPLDAARPRAGPRGIAFTSPNPAVGCVILDRAGQVVGEGWHEYDLLDHAEVVALGEAAQHAGDRLRGGTAYVTLEPCNHTGRTGPCTEALIAAGLERVVAATVDPNPNVAGHGMRAPASAAGIETTHRASAKPKRAASTKLSPAGSSTSAPSC